MSGSDADNYINITDLQPLLGQTINCDNSDY